MPDSAVMESTEEKEDVLKDFSYVDYKALVPEGIQESLEKVFTSQVYGWKRKARILLRLDNAHSHVKSIEQELLNACEGRSTTRTPRSREDIARVSLRNFINSLEEDKLRQLCVRHSVSYDSFINSNDKVGLVEALVD